MKACPLTFSHPSEAQQLHGVGAKLCEKLTEALKKHCEANGLPAPKKCCSTPPQFDLVLIADGHQPANAKALKDLDLLPKKRPHPRSLERLSDTYPNIDQGHMRFSLLLHHFTKTQSKALPNQNYRYLRRNIVNLHLPYRVSLASSTQHGLR